MQIYMFHLMPYPHLPENFDDFESAWVTFPNRFYDPKVGVELYNRYLDELEYAEELGFDGACVNEHHQNAYGTMPAPNIMAAALVRRTHRMNIAIVGNGLPLREHPLRIAEEVAMLDVISNGRIISGFVRGIGDEYFSMELNPTESRSRFSEAHDLILKAWTTDGPFRWDGEHYRFRYVNPWPRPVQQPHPPIWVPAFGSRETMTWTAEHHYTYLSVFAPVTLIKLWFDQFRGECEKVGYTPDPSKVGILLPIYVAETDEQAHAEGRDHILWLYHKGLKHKSEHFFPPGYLTEDAWSRMLQSGMKDYGEQSYEELLESGHAVVGSPETVRERIAELSESMGFGLLCALLHIGDMPHHRTVKNMELFAREVMPHLRPLQEVSAFGSAQG